MGEKSTPRSPANPTPQPVSLHSNNGLTTLNFDRLLTHEDSLDSGETTDLLPELVYPLTSRV